VSDDPQGRPFGRRRDGCNGSPPQDMTTQPVPIEQVREPLDLVAVQADDELINALAAGFTVSADAAAGRPGRRDADDHVAAMLAAWKADVEAAPLPAIDLDAAVGAVLDGQRAARRPNGRMRHLVPLAGAAAVIVVAVAGVSVVAHESRPEDALFALSEVLYPEQAASYKALEAVAHAEDRAEQALAVGDKAAAATAVAEAEAAAGTVLAEHGQGEVLEELRQLEVKVEQTVPGVPNPVDEHEAQAQSARPESGQPANPSHQPGPSGQPGPSDPSDPSDPSGGGTTSPTDPGTPPSQSGAGQPDADQAPSSGGQSSDPQPDTTSPDPRATAADPRSADRGPSSPEPGPESAPGPTHEPEPSKGSTSKPESPPQSDDPDPTTSPSSTGPRHTSGSGSTTSPDEGPPESEGLSGMSSSATGTAEPSGEDSSG